MFNSNREEPSQYPYRVPKYVPNEQSKTLEWNVIIEDNGRIVVFNVFDHYGFLRDLVKAKKQYKKDLKEMTEEKALERFVEKVDRELSYYYWSKCEWEVIVTSWPPYVTDAELKKVQEESEEHIKKYGSAFFRHTVNLDTADKIDVHTQIKLNWKQFIDYLIANMKYIKEPK